jgi:hypothetical protein
MASWAAIGRRLETLGKAVSGVRIALQAWKRKPLSKGALPRSESGLGGIRLKLPESR